ncbi:MAG: hypothetical protein ACHQII_01610 [Bacteroidia bacterium]
MKKSVLALAMAFGVTSAFAQDLTSKKGEPILPEAGDWAISADATPFLNYAGNLFGKTANNVAPTMNFLGSNSLIMGKYFKDEKTAYRVGLNIGFNSQSATNLVAENQEVIAAGAAPTMLTDKTSVSTTGIGITAGIEKRKGKTRLQGYYGAEAGIYLAGVHQKNTYGNAFAGTGTQAGTDANPTSTVWNTGNTGNTGATGAAANGRVTDWKSGTTFQFGVRGFVGVEYFILPKMSLGGEFGWGIGISTTGAGQSTVENIYTGTSPSTHVAKTGSSSAFVIGTDNKNSMFGPTGSLRANFYF